MNSDSVRSRAANFIKDTQLATGGYMSDSSFTQQPFSSVVSYETTFFPSLILLALSVGGDPELQSVKDKLAAFLWRQASPQLTFNYWAKHADTYKDLPYPDDMDDTFCALTALKIYQPEVFDGELLARIAHLLIDREQAPGGPYRTGFVGDRHLSVADQAWQRVDVIVNANISAFLATEDVVLEPLSRYVKQAIAKKKLLTPYYPDICASSYLLSRSRLDTTTRRHLQAQVLAERDTAHVHWQTPLRTALAIVTLLRLNYPAPQLTATIQWLKVRQAADGSWPVDAFSIDPSLGGKTCYAGSAAFTTAICYEALTMYHQRRTSTGHGAQLASPQSEVIVSAIEAKIAGIARDDLRESVEVMVNKMLIKDADKHITGVPWLMARGVEQQLEARVLQQLSAASLWGWVSYTAFDDFMDGDSGADELPAALFCNRQLINCLQAVLPGVNGFQDEVSRLLTRIDAANDWELKHCRGRLQGDWFAIKKLPDYDNYWQLADRSIGHAIAALGVLYACDYREDSPETQATHRFFEHFLIAKQLLDEAHDWQTDLHSGHVNAVAALLLNNLYGTNYWSGGFSLSRAIPQLQSMLWNDLIAEVCSLISDHIQAARDALNGSLSMDGSGLIALLRPLEAATQRTLHERNESLAFLHAF